MRLTRRRVAVWLSAGVSAFRGCILKHGTSINAKRNTKRAARARHFGLGPPGWRVVKFGSNANNTLNTGAFYVNANNTSSNDNVNIGRRLYLWITKTFHWGPGPCHLAKHKAKPVCWC
jgi:hypothetical protein